jgi:hypothetical protein
VQELMALLQLHVPLVELVLALLQLVLQQLAQLELAQLLLQLAKPVLLEQALRYKKYSVE